METKPAPTRAARSADLLDELLDELASRGGAGPQLRLPMGRRLDVCEGEQGAVLRVLRPDGHIELTIEIGPQGPVVRVDAAALEVACTGKFSIACDSLDVRATHRADLVCERGDVRLDAGDDVVVTGERIRLN